VPDWDEGSPILRKNLAQVTQEINRTAKRRETPTLQGARRWHAMIMRGLEVPAPEYVGAFRGGPGVENIGVEIGGRRGVVSTEVVGELRRFESTLQALVANLDSVVPVGHELNADELAAVLDLCAWAHAEWVRIHPFVNGNAPRESGPIVWQSVTAFQDSCACGRARTRVMLKPGSKRCRATGSLPPCFSTHA